MQAEVVLPIPWPPPGTAFGDCETLLWVPATDSLSWNNFLLLCPLPRWRNSCLHSAISCSPSSWTCLWESRYEQEQLWGCRRAQSRLWPMRECYVLVKTTAPVVARGKYTVQGQLLRAEGIWAGAYLRGAQKSPPCSVSLLEGLKGGRDRKGRHHAGHDWGPFCPALHQVLVPCSYTGALWMSAGSF